MTIKSMTENELLDLIHSLHLFDDIDNYRKEDYNKAKYIITNSLGKLSENKTKGH